MPHELFGDVTLRPSSVRSRRSPVVVFSILVHVAALIALCIVPLLATDTLPTPRRVIDYFLPHEVMPAVVAPRSDSAPSNGTAAPLDAPTGIGAETGRRGHDGGLGRAVRRSPERSKACRAAAASRRASPAGADRADPAVLRDPHAAEARRRGADLSGDRAAAHAEGLVIIEATIDVHGNVTAVRVLRSQPLLEQAALDAVRQWKFTPTLLNGVPTPIIMTVTVNFTLRMRGVGRAR